MSEMRQRTVQCLSPAGFHDMAYVEWGDPANPKVLVCVHGLTRCGRDFDYLARALAGTYRVVCPDVVGRGRSAWLRDARHYTVPQYCSDMASLLARVDGETIHWLGTSMGGLIGMALAAQSETPISRLILNDVGPVVTAAAIARIGEYLGRAPHFPSLEAAESYVRTVSAPFGALGDDQWRHLTVHALRQTSEGAYAMAYDPAIAEPFRAAMGDGQDVELWSLYDGVRCPTLVLRGAESDLLKRETAEAMQTRGPRARLVEVAGVGHAPMLMDDRQIAIVRDFLLG
jgi:pimeloyl-ACP methyl ester carboxylesterase